MSAAPAGASAADHTAQTVAQQRDPSTAPAVAAIHYVREQLRRLGLPASSGTGEHERISCAIRELALGTKLHRAPLLVSELESLRTVDLLLVPSGAVEGVNVSLVCQIGYFVRSGEVTHVFRVSTGKAGMRTTPGTYKVGWKVDGWRESGSYPGSMMYRPIYFNNGQAIHGMSSESMVKSVPASHGCVRTPKRDVDWIWENWSSSDRIRVYGNWR